jgi:UDP-galactopyranose mutase
MPQTIAATRRCVVVGAGLTGATTAWSLARQGFEVTVYERDRWVGGHARNEWWGPIPYEPNGAHIFHTSDQEVWELATSVGEFAPYHHRVLTRIDGQLLSWPIQLEEVQGLAAWPRIEAELGRRPLAPDPANFETWCVGIMGPTLYEMYIEGYTTKHWGRPAAELSSSFAPRRVELRDDGYLGLFRDPYQGWPRHGYAALVEALLTECDVRLATEVAAAKLDELTPPGTPVVVTAPLDGFFDAAEGELEWRGVRLEPRFIPHVRSAQPASVVNEPSATVPYTRTIESKWVLPELMNTPGTVVCYEYPGAPAKHYPVADAKGDNRRTQERYERLATMYTRNPLVPAGRLARYVYINMDQAMREGLDAAKRVTELAPV